MHECLVSNLDNSTDCTDPRRKHVRHQLKTRLIFTMMLLPLILFVLLLPSTAYSKTRSIEILQEACEREILEYANGARGKFFRKANEIDEYCGGFLEGVLAAREHLNIICPQWKMDRIDADYMLSVFKNFIEEVPSKNKRASVVFAKVYIRAFPCYQE